MVDRLDVCEHCGDGLIGPHEGDKWCAACAEDRRIAALSEEEFAAGFDREPAPMRGAVSPDDHGDYDALPLHERMRLLADQADEEHVRAWADEVERTATLRPPV